LAALGVVIYLFSFHATSAEKRSAFPHFQFASRGCLVDWPRRIAAAQRCAGRFARCHPQALAQRSRFITRAPAVRKPIGRDTEERQCRESQSFYRTQRC
jgi:hypothetical protein